MNTECKPISFEDFDKSYRTIVEEIGLKEDGTIASHPLKPDIYVYSNDPTDDYDYEVVAVEPTMMLGCGCWDGVRIIISRSKEE